VRVATGIAALLLIGVIAALAPLAAADPPDPTWIGGCWDDDDYDNVVVLVLHASAITELPSLDAGPLRGIIALVEPLTIHATPSGVDATASPRAPPVTAASS
jgi:hypothetical protein